MKLEPTNLNIPVETNGLFQLGIKIVVACILITTASAFFAPPFAITFLAATLICLPVLLMLAFPSLLATKLQALGDLGRIISAGLFVGYIALSKAVLLPFLIGVLERVFA